MDTKAITEHIRAILTAPDVDLATISSKKVRKVLAESFGASLIKENKEAIDALIIDAFNRIATAAGATSSAASTTINTAPANVKAEANHAPVKSGSIAPSSAARNGTSAAGEGSTSSSSKQRDRLKQQQPEQSEASEEEEEDASGSESEPQKPATLKQSPQKKKITSSNAVASSSFPPASSPSVPLSMATGLTDEEYARKLQEEYNNMASGGRATRGSASTSSRRSGGKTKRGKSESKSGNGSSKRYRSKAYIDDSDLDGEEGGHDGSEGDDGSASDVPKKKKRKASSSGGGGGGSGGGYNKELALSESLQKVCGQPTMSRPKIVKRLWEYIREHELQDPKKKSDIINDDLFKEIFGVEKMTMFSMNKYLTKSVSPIDG